MNEKKLSCFVYKFSITVYPKLLLTDDYGRYVGVEINLQGATTLLLGIFAPNEIKQHFIKNLWVNYSIFL